MRTFFVKRLFGYPLLYAFIWYYLYQNFTDLYFVNIAVRQINSIVREFPFIYSNMSTYFILFGFIFGYIYSTISTLLKAREFRGILFVCVLSTKTLFAIMTIPFGIIFYLVECISLIIIMTSLFLFRNMKYRYLVN
ncbi:hypothetical protein BK777_00610 [Bacillus thuringiensis serovar aizawai]|nr:hypothetical protein BK777_00610 [Bacillus thuringiensis serovar aizawai]